MRKNKLIIIGAGNVGGFLANNISLFLGNYEIIGLLDDDPAKQGETLWGLEVLGPTDRITDFQGCSVAVGIAFPSSKKKILERLDLEKFNFPSFVSSNAWISHDVEIGRGVIIYPGVSVNYGSRIGDFSVINMNCALGHHASLNKYCALAPGVNLGGITSLGEGVDMGISSATKQSITVGCNSVIGGQAMVLHNIPDNVTAVGIPAQIIRRQ